VSIPARVDHRPWDRDVVFRLAAPFAKR